MQRGVASPATTPRACPQCGGALRASHREYAGAGSSVTVWRCGQCGRILKSAPRSDSDRQGSAKRASRRHAPVDEGPPSNPVIAPDLAARLLDQLGGD